MRLHYIDPDWVLRDGRWCPPTPEERAASILAEAIRETRERPEPKPAPEPELKQVYLGCITQVETTTTEGFSVLFMDESMNGFREFLARAGQLVETGERYQIRLVMEELPPQKGKP